MPELPARSLLIYAVLAAVVVGLGARQVLAQRSGGDGSAGVAQEDAGGPREGAGDAAGGREAAGADGGAGDATVSVSGSTSGSTKRVTVHVAGAVRNPGVYRLPAGARVDAAVRRAGGPRAGADLTAVNLAAPVEDGRQVIVPARAAAGGAGAGGGAAGPVAASSPSASGGGSAAGAVPAAKVNLNTATLEQLDTLDGVGPGIAGKILAYRQEHGGFKTVQELGEVPGIGEKRLAALEELVSV